MKIKVIETQELHNVNFSAYGFDLDDLSFGLSLSNNAIDCLLSLEDWQALNHSVNRLDLLTDRINELDCTCRNVGLSCLAEELKEELIIVLEDYFLNDRSLEGLYTLSCDIDDICMTIANQLDEFI